MPNFMKKMTRKLLLLFSLFFLFIFFSNAKAQEQETNDKQLFPKFTVGGALGYFASSVKNFDDVYGSSSGFLYGLDASMRFSKLEKNKRIYGVMQYYVFNKSGKTVGDIKVDTKWKQNILNFGGRYCWDAKNNIRMWLGGGVSLINVNEKFNALGEKVSVDKSTTGFYLEYGDAGKLNKATEFFLNFKYDFGKIRSEGAAGDNPNVGGFTIVVGIKLSSF